MAPDCLQPAPENPAKCPDFWAIRKSVIQGHFEKITCICPLIRIPKMAVFFVSGLPWPDRREIGHRKAIMAVSGGGRNPAVLWAHFGRENGDLGIFLYDGRKNGGGLPDPLCRKYDQFRKSVFEIAVTILHSPHKGCHPPGIKIPRGIDAGHIFSLKHRFHPLRFALV